jgi:copper resistance protein B
MNRGPDMNGTSMNSALQRRLTAGAFATVAAFIAMPALAVGDAPQAGAGHSLHHGMTAAPAEPMAAMTPTAAPADKPMQMQGGGVPVDARDPHGYSGGFTLDTGPYALAGPRQLRLADESAFGSVLFDKFEAVRSNGSNSAAYDLYARIGRDYDRLVIKAEGDVASGRLQEARTEALWSHAVASFWDAQLGLRHDSGTSPERSWIAFGIQGLAPYWFELDAAAYVGDGGRTALRLSAEYELLITQKLILQPQVEVNLYGKSDPARDIGKGLSDLTAGLRLRYEFNRQFAPYIGVAWADRFGETADLARAAGEPKHNTRYVAGVRFWF